jgi:hypothetical protein
MFVSLLFDVEDIVSPEADDIALTVANMLSQLGACATFCVVGERVRQWVERGRSDVIAALARHDIGFHTDLHSVHPTIVEYLADKAWEAGIAEVVRRESPGIEAIRETFGVLPSCWGGPGNTWGPQVNSAMLQLGVPSIVYAYTVVPDAGAHRFAGALSYPDGPAMHDGRYHDRTEWERDLARLVHHLADERDRGARWRSVFLGHPTRILHREFWDGVNFARGCNPPRSAWRSARRKSDAELHAALHNLERTVQFVTHVPNVELRTIRQMNEVYVKTADKPLDTTELEAVWPQIERNLASMAEWPILPAGFDVTPIQSMTRSRLNTLRRLLPPDGFAEG